jgi:transposase
LAAAIRAASFASDKRTDWVDGRRMGNHRAARPAGDNRRYFEGMLWIARTGSQWRHLLDGYGKWNSIFRRFRRWVEVGVFDALLETLVDTSKCSVMLRRSRLPRLTCSGRGQHRPDRQSINRQPRCSEEAPSTELLSPHKPLSWCALKCRHFVVHTGPISSTVSSRCRPAQP